MTTQEPFHPHAALDMGLTIEGAQPGIPKSVPQRENVPFPTPKPLPIPQEPMPMPQPATHPEQPEEVPLTPEKEPEKVD